MATFLYRAVTAPDGSGGSDGAGGVGGFGDVVAGGAHAGDVATLGGLGVLEGTECAEGLFCGSDPIRRWTLAVWLARVLYDGEPPAGVGRFEDVESDRWWAPHVEGLVSLGVTSGCSAEPLLFCPDEVVTRGQMASFLVRAFGLPTAGDAGFVDVAGSSHRSDIDALSAAGVTSGCSVEPLRYCPDAATTRGQMASFLTRAVNYRAGAGEEDAGADVLGEGGGGGGGGGSGGPARRSPVRLEIESDLEGTATGRFNVVLRFSREVTTRFEGTDVTSVNGTVSVPARVADDPLAWIVTVIPDTGLEGDVTVEVAEGTVGIREAVSRSFPVDTLAPTVEISAASGPHSEPFTATFRWSEPVDGFDDGDVTVVGGSLGTLTAGGVGDRMWTTTVTPDEGRVDDVVVSVAASGVTDRLGNPSTEGSARFTVDTVAPTFTRANITGDSLVLAVSETLTSAPRRGGFAVTATDHVTGVETQPGVDSVSMEGQLVTLTLATAVRHDDTLTVVYTPGANPPEDSAGNSLAPFDMAASNDTAEATDSTLSSLTLAPVGITFNAQTVNYDVEVVKTVSEGTITAQASDSRASVAFSGAVTAGGTAFSLSPGANLATVTVTAENGDTRDYTITINREQDTEVPTVAISGPSTTRKEAFTVTFTWSETVSGFTSGDVTLSSGSLSGFVQDTTDQLVWTATVTPATGRQGNLTVTVAAAAVTDGINNNAVALKNFAVDTKKPTATLAVQERFLYAPGIINGGNSGFISIASFDEDVKPFDSNSVTVTNGTLHSVACPPGQSVVRSCEIWVATPSEGTVTVTLNTGSVEDAVGNTIGTTTELSALIDNTAPTVELASTSAVLVSAAFDISIGFGEAVTGFEADDITVANGTLSNFTGSGDTYSATVTPTHNDTVTVTVGSAAAQDRAGNGNPSATLERFAAITAPTLTLHHGSGYITVEWEFTISITTSVETGYRIEWKQQSEQWSDASSATTSLQARGYTITDLTNGQAYDVRVAFTYGESTGAWGTGSATPNPATGGPRDLSVRARHERLRMQWTASTDTDVDSYVLEWKTGTQNYSTDRQHTVTDLTDLHKWIRDLENDTVYVIRVTAMDGTDSVGSAVIAAHPIHAAVYIEEEFVQPTEDEFPWIRQVWDQGYPVWIHDRISSGALATAPYRYVTSEDGFWRVGSGIGINYTFWSYQDRLVNYHELAHHFTIDHRVPDVPGPVGIGWTYVDHRLGGNGRQCRGTLELYADMVMSVTSGALGGGYLSWCEKLQANSNLDQHGQDTLGSVLAGDIPQWFYDHYRRDDMTLDLHALWLDVRAGAHPRKALYHMRDLFGGFCSVRGASLAMGRPAPDYGHVWADGGCEWRRPQQLSLVSSGTTGLTVSWQEPLSERPPDVTHYVVQWKTGAEEYDSTRRAVVAESSGVMSHTITGLTSGARYQVRVAAVNTDSRTVFTDDDQRERTAEATGIVGAPGVPNDVAAVSGDGTITVSWSPPQDGQTVTGYVVHWKTGSEEYDSGRSTTLGADAGSTVLNRDNSDLHTIRVSAVAGTVTGLGAETTGRASVPGPPGSVDALGGQRSLNVTWSQPAANGSTITGYKLQWRSGRGVYNTTKTTTVTGADTLSHEIEDLFDQHSYTVRVIAVSDNGDGAPSEEFTEITSQPGPPTDFTAAKRTGGGFTLSWSRPERYYLDSSYRPVRDSNEDPILDSNGNQVPQFRYDIEHRSADDPDAEWIYYWRNRDVDRGSDTLTQPFTFDMTRFGENPEPVAGTRYEFRIRAEYVWLNAGTNTGRASDWVYSSPVTY